MKLNLRGFKKLSSDKTHTVMQHPAGHQIKVLHSALSPELRKQIHALPSEGAKMAEGGEVKKPEQQDPYKAAGENIAKGASGEAGKKAQESLKKSFGFAEGGEVKKDGYNPKGKPYMDEKAAAQVSKGVNEFEDPLISKAKKILHFANGGEAEAPQDEQQKSIPINININGQPANQQPAIPQQMVQMPQDQAPAPQQPALYGQDHPYGTPAQTPMPQQAEEAINIPQPAQESQASAPPAQEAPAQPQAGLAAQQPAAQQPKPDPFGVGTQSEAAVKGMEEQRAGILGQAQAAQLQANAEAGALQNLAKQQLDAKKVFQSHYDQLNAERQALMQDYEKGHIDPNRVWANRSTAGKIGTVLGMIISGFGAGASGENLAFKVLNDQINRDIDSQKAELDKKHNLLAANFQSFGNLRDATDMTRVMLNDNATTQLKLAAAKAASPAAKAAALMAIGKLDSENSALLGQLAMRKSLLTGMQSGAVSPDKIVNFLVPEHQRAQATKELADANELVKARDAALSTFDKLAQINTVGGKLNPQVRSQIKGMLGAVVPALSKATAGRFTEADAGYIENIFANALDNPGTIAQKRASLVKLLEEKIDPLQFPTLTSYGINIGQMGRYQPGGGSRIPESAPVLKK